MSFLGRVATSMFMSLAVAEALEPAAPFGVQEVWQAGLPNTIHINYDVPTSGLVGELNALKRTADAEASFQGILTNSAAQSSFLNRASGDVDAFFEAPPVASSYEGSYQAVLASLKKSIDAEVGAMRASVLKSVKSSFLAAPQRSPALHLSVGAGSGKNIDADRLRDDLRAYMKQRLDALELEILKVSGKSSSFLGLIGDARPYPLPTVDVSIEQPAYANTFRETEIGNRAEKLAALSADLKSAYSKAGATLSK